MKRSSTALAIAPADLFLVLLPPLIALAVMMAIDTALRDGDTGWHIATGAWIVEHLQVPRTDPFSFTAEGKAWVAHEWVSELLMYGAWRAAGWSGVMLLFGLAAALLYLLVVLHLRRWQSPPACVLMLIYMTMGLMPMLAARPHMLALPILAGWVILLMRYRERDGVPPLWLALLMLLWANMHGSFVLGIGIAGVFGLEALVAARPEVRVRTALGWGLFGAALLLAGLMTPAGVEGLIYPFYVSNLAILKFISEWRPANFETIGPFEIVLLSSIFFLLLRPVRVPVLRLLLVLALLHLGLQHMRQTVVLVLVATLILSQPLGDAWAGDAERPRWPFLPAVRRNARALAPILAVTALLYLGTAAARLIIPFSRPDSSGVPMTAIAHIPPALRTQPVFNEYSFGGLLIMNGIRAYIDGRSDMYGDAFTTDYYLISKGDLARWRAADAKWRFGWTMLPPDNPLVAMLDRAPGWRRLYADKWAVIHVSDRAGSAPGAAGAVTPAGAADRSGSPASTGSDKAATARR